MRVVLADDSATERAQARRMLVELGHEVVAECENGVDAIAAVERERADFLVLDVVMRVMTDDAAAIELRRRGYLGGIVFATKSSHPALQHTMLSVGASLCVKMYRADRLAATIEEAFRIGPRIPQP